MLARLRGRGWLVATMVNAVFVQAGVFVARPMVSYRAVELGAGPVLVGFLGAAFALLPLAVALPFGRAVDRRGERPFLFYGTLLAAVASGLAAVQGGIAWLLLTTALLGLGHMNVMIASQALVGNRAQAGGGERDFALYTLAVSVGQFVGPLAGGVVAGSEGGLPRSTGAAFLFGCGLLVAGALVIAAWGIPRRAWLRPDRLASGRGSARGLLRLSGMKPALLASSTLLAAVDVIVVFLPVLGEELGLSPLTVGALLSARAGATMVARVLMGPLLRLAGPRWLLLGSLWASAAACLSMAFADRVALLAALLVTVGITLGLGQPVTMAWVARRAPDHQRGLAMSLRITGNRFTQVAVPAAMGAVAGSLGTGGAFALLSVALALSALFVNTRG